MLWQRRQNLGQWRIRQLHHFQGTQKEGEMSHQKISSSYKCNCQISILLWADIYCYVDAQYTNLHHKGHPQVLPSAKKLGSANISDQQAFILRQLSVMGVQKSKISSLLSSMDEAKDHFPFKLSRTTGMHVRYWKESNLVWITVCFCRGSNWIHSQVRVTFSLFQ